MMIQIKPSMFNPSLDRDPMTTQREAAHWLLHDQSTEAKVVRGVILLSGTAFIGGPVVGRVATFTQPVRNILTWIKHPIAKSLATQTSYRSVQMGARGYLTGMKAIRYTGYAAAVYSPFETYRYLTEGDYKRAALQWYGPPGTVYMYNKLTMEPVNSQARMEELKKGSRKSKNQDRRSAASKSKKKSSMTAKQRRRLNRMGLRYCPTHRRYDRCARK